MKTEVKNAIIESATITTAERGLLTAYLHLDYGNGSGQSFGGFVLYLPKSFDHHNVIGPAGHFIFRVMEIAGVEFWKDLPGKTIRAKMTHDKVEAIGHIVNDDWFYPADDFEAMKRGAVKFIPKTTGEDK